MLGGTDVTSAICHELSLLSGREAVKYQTQKTVFPTPGCRRRERYQQAVICRGLEIRAQTHDFRLISYKHKCHLRKCTIEA